MPQGNPYWARVLLSVPLAVLRRGPQGVPRGARRPKPGAGVPRPADLSPRAPVALLETPAVRPAGARQEGRGGPPVEETQIPRDFAG